ncbi:Hsp20/alpha crystallin family protein [Niabella hibiscisoli]|uniref:Hsp20/alpha crystallin family protein n=1 Tax=Niabella hibiscisoli TaxID=1825928 RepID=UPI0021D461BC|nr:Hsp20/alpha crystallin family protein [Niabella hibiscisoli]
MSQFTFNKSHIVIKNALVYNLTTSRYNKLFQKLKFNTMTNVKFNGVPFERTFTSLVDDFFTEIPGLLKTEVAKPNIKGHAPVNITEHENEYEIEVVAPGYDKSDFKIKVENNILTISAEKRRKIRKSQVNL